VVYWRGRVLGGVEQKGLRWAYAEKYARKHGLAFGEVLTLCRLAVGLASHTKGGGGFGSAGIEGGKGGKEGGHGSLSVRRARRLVVAAPSWGRYAMPTYKRQRVIDALGRHGSKNPLASA